MNRIRVAIVDDNEALRAGLAVFLSAFDDFLLVGTGTDGADVIKLCEETQPDVVLMDLVMPGINGASATRMLKQAYPRVQVIALTSFENQGLTREALENGAAACLLKNVLIDEMAEAIRAAVSMVADDQE
jgi:two-component system, NarL family, response regulator LiaR